jgi:hypothetical protein
MARNCGWNVLEIFGFSGTFWKLWPEIADGTSWKFSDFLELLGDYGQKLRMELLGNFRIFWREIADGT